MQLLPIDLSPDSPASARGKTRLANASRWSRRSLLGTLRFVLKYQTPVLPVTSGLRGPGLYLWPLRWARVGCCPTTREISSGSSASPANRNVANTWLALSEFVIDVAEVFAVLIRHRPIVIYDNAIHSTKIARGLNLMNRPSELPVLDAEPIADVFRRICWLVPNDPGHSGLYSPCGRSIVKRLAGSSISKAIYEKTVNGKSTRGLVRPAALDGRPLRFAQV